MVIVELPWPSSRLNAHAKGHWRTKSGATKAYRKAAFVVAKAAGVTTNPDAILVFTYHPPDRRRRDAQNMPSMLKAAVDGIADAMGCDDHKFRCRFPDSFSDPVQGGSVIVRVQ